MILLSPMQSHLISAVFGLLLVMFCIILHGGAHELSPRPSLPITSQVKSPMPPPRDAMPGKRLPPKTNPHTQQFLNNKTLERKENTEIVRNHEIINKWSGITFSNLVINQSSSHHIKPESSFHNKGTHFSPSRLSTIKSRAEGRKTKVNSFVFRTFKNYWDSNIFFPTLFISQNLDKWNPYLN